MLGWDGSSGSSLLLFLRDVCRLFWNQMFTLLKLLGVHMRCIQQWLLTVSLHLHSNLATEEFFLVSAWVSGAPKKALKPLELIICHAVPCLLLLSSSRVRWSDIPVAPEIRAVVLVCPRDLRARTRTHPEPEKMTAQREEDEAGHRNVQRSLNPDADNKR